MNKDDKLYNSILEELLTGIDEEKGMNKNSSEVASHSSEDTSQSSEDDSYFLEDELFPDDFLNYIDENTDEVLEGRLDLEDKKLRHIELGDEFSFDKMYVNRAKKKSKPKPFIGKKEKGKKTPKKSDPIPIKVPTEEDYIGVLPEDRIPILTNTVKDIKENPSIGIIKDKEVRSKIGGKKEKKVIERPSAPLVNLSAEETIIDEKGTTLAELMASKGSKVSIKPLEKKADPVYIKDKREMKNDKVKRLSTRLGIDETTLLNVVNHDGVNNKTERERLIGVPSRWERETVVNNKKKFRTDAEDREVLLFLSKFKLATASILKNINGWTLEQTYFRMNSMKEAGLVYDYILPGISNLWYLSQLGATFTEMRIPPLDRKILPKTSTISNLMAENYVASYLWGNTYNILDAEEFPYHGRLVGNNYIRGENLVSESLIKSSLHSMQIIESKRQGRSQDYKGEYFNNVNLYGKHLIEKWKSEGGVEPELVEGNEFMWSAFPKEDIGIVYHNPDIVIARQRNESGGPESIAVEVERKRSTPELYRRTMQAYKDNLDIYKKVVWVVDSLQRARQVAYGVRSSGFPKGACNIVPFSGPDGSFVPTDAWFL